MTLFLDVLMDSYMQGERESESLSEASLTSDVESISSVHREASNLEVELSKYLQPEYHAAIFSDANFVPEHLQQKVQQFKQKLIEEVIINANIAQELRDAQFKIEELDSKIIGLRNVQKTIQKARTDEAVKAREAAMHAASIQQANQQQEVRLSTKLNQLKIEVDKKRKSQEAVLTFLNRAIQVQEEAIEEWENRIAELKERMEIEAEMGGFSQGFNEQQREAQAKLQEDRRAGLKLSILKLKEFITQNQQYLH